MDDITSQLTEKAAVFIATAVYAPASIPARPEADADQLRDIATWLDGIDNAAREHGFVYSTVNDGIQYDLRRIAERLDLLDTCDDCGRTDGSHDPDVEH